MNLSTITSLFGVKQSPTVAPLMSVPSTMAKPTIDLSVPTVVETATFALG